MTPHDVKNAILDWDYDILGLYEIIWSLNYNFPNESTSNKILMSQPILLSLLKEGNALLYLINWDTNEYQQVEEANYDQIVNNPKSWNPPSEATSLYYGYELVQMD